MTRATIAGSAFAALLVLLAAAAGYLALTRNVGPVEVPPSAIAAPTLPGSTATHATPDTPQGFLYGRVTTPGGTTYEGRLRWGRAEEAFWDDYFNGFKDENPWAAHAPRERTSVELFGFRVRDREREADVRRPFMARFGEIARIDVRGDDLLVTLTNGTEFVLDRMAADDLADGLRVWDARGVVDLEERSIRSVELLPTPSLDTVPYRLHGTVRTQEGEFTGFVQWNREDCVGPDELDGHTAEGKLGVRFDTIRSIARSSGDGVLVTLLDDREIELTGARDVGEDNRGIYVDDPRYGRVMISWDTFERADFGPAGSGPGRDDFPHPRPLTGEVTTRAGDRFTGRLVYDLDEGETIETLDAPSRGVNYTIPLGLIASIVPPGRDEHASVTLHGGEELRLERSGDLGDGNAGMLIFVHGGDEPEFVAWADVARIDLDRPAAMYPPLSPN